MKMKFLLLNSIWINVPSLHPRKDNIKMSYIFKIRKKDIKDLKHHHVMSMFEYKIEKYRDEKWNKDILFPINECVQMNVE